MRRSSARAVGPDCNSELLDRALWPSVPFGVNNKGTEKLWVKSESIMDEGPFD